MQNKLKNVGSDVNIQWTYYDMVSSKFYFDHLKIIEDISPEHENLQKAQLKRDIHHFLCLISAVSRFAYHEITHNTGQV